MMKKNRHKLQKAALALSIFYFKLDFLPKGNKYFVLEGTSVGGTVRADQLLSTLSFLTLT